MSTDTPDVLMNWTNLLFLHWRVEPAEMRRLVPEPLEVDVFDGSAWIGLVPFKMERCSFCGVPRLPGLANFYECNVRTYATYRGKVGVWFFSLDAERLIPVLGGRWMWNLNYVHSTFHVNRSGSGAGGAEITDYRLSRRRGPWKSAHSHIRWRAGERLPTSRPGSLEYFLTERYWLFTMRGRGAKRRVLAGEVRHEPWPLCGAEMLHLDDSLVAAAGVQTSGPPIVHASQHIAVRGYKLCEP